MSYEATTNQVDPRDDLEEEVGDNGGDPTVWYLVKDIAAAKDSGTDDDCVTPAVARDRRIDRQR